MLRAVFIVTVILGSPFNVAALLGLVCTKPEAPEHGSVGTFLHFAYYSCSKGTTLYGHSWSKCILGYWLFNPPECLKSCYVSAVENGQIGRYETTGIFITEGDFICLPKGELVEHDKEVFVRCNTGYFPGNKISRREIRITCDDGTWSEPMYCRSEKNVCSRPPDIDGIISPVLDGEEHPVGTITSYQCKFGFVGSSPSSLISVCRIDSHSGNAKWTSPDVTCVPISCPEFQTYDGLSVIYSNSRKVNSVAIFSCLNQAILVGNSTAECLGNGTWSHPQPICKSYCQVIKDERSQLIVEPVQDYYFFGEFIILSCPPGQNLSPQVERMACMGETWSNMLPNCMV